MNPAILQKVETILTKDRLGVYRQDGATPEIALARYSLNIALSEALYPTLQFAEIALRNAIHAALTSHTGTDSWYDNLPALTTWQVQQVDDARLKLRDTNKTVTSGRMVAELNFGFWTGFFNKVHSRTGIGHLVVRNVFMQAPRPERDLAKLDSRWKRIRDLRNRIFHHERILHWKDLDAQQAAILQTIAWMSPELHELATVHDRYTSIRAAGLNPWLQSLEQQWP